MKKKKKNSYLNRTVYLFIILFVMLFIEYFLTGQSIVVGVGNGTCLHDELSVSLFDTGRYISMMSIAILMLLTVLFRKKSNKFFLILLLVSSVFIFVLPIVYSMRSTYIRNNDICKGDSWDSKYCQYVDGECLEEIEVSKYEK